MFDTCYLKRNSIYMSRSSQITKWFWWKEWNMTAKRWRPFLALRKLFLVALLNWYWVSQWVCRKALTSSMQRLCHIPQILLWRRGNIMLFRQIKGRARRLGIRQRRLYPVGRGRPQIPHRITGLGIWKVMQFLTDGEIKRTKLAKEWSLINVCFSLIKIYWLNDIGED